MEFFYELKTKDYEPAYCQFRIFSFMVKDFWLLNPLARHEMVTDMATSSPEIWVKLTVLVKIVSGQEALYP